MNKLFLAIVLTLTLFSCSREDRDCPTSSEKTFAFSGFTRIRAGETFSLQVKQGTAYSIKATGCVNDLADLDVDVEQDGTLAISYNRYKSNRYRVNVDITLPSITRLTLGGAATATVSGFGQQANALRATVSGTAKCTIGDLPALVSVDASGAGAVTLTGTTPDLIAKLSGDARLNAYTATVSDADVSASGTAKAYVVVQQSLAANASGDSRIYYKGNPATVNVETTGTAKVIRE